MIFNIIEIGKIDKRFFRWRQTEMNELIGEYLEDLAYENKVDILELPKIYGLKDLRYMVKRFKDTVELVWIEQENRND